MATKAELVKENKKLRKDLDDLIHDFYSTNTWIKNAEMNGGDGIEDTCTGFFFTKLGNMPALAKKHGLYPYNQPEVRMKRVWSKLGPPNVPKVYDKRGKVIGAK